TASLSYVSSTSPLPARNVLVALRPELSCETTWEKSFCTNVRACSSVLPSRRAAAYAASTFHFAEPELKGFGVTICTPGLTRSSQVLMCFGLPPRNATTTTEYASSPPCDWFCQFLSTSPASTSESTSRPV